MIFHFRLIESILILLIELHCIVSVSYKIQQYKFIIAVYWFGRDRDVFFVLALLLLILTPLFLPSSVYLIYFILALPIRERLRKNLCMSSPFSTALLNCTFFSRKTRWSRVNCQKLSIIIWQFQTLAKSTISIVITWNFLTLFPRLYNNGI